jgi:DNA-binding HxlR family transcriptional regulator
MNKKKEPLCDDIAGDGCGLKKVIGIIGGKWKIKVLCTLHYNETLRYSDIKRLVTGISPTMLANSLRELEESGLVAREIQDTMPVRVDYSLTDAGRSLIPILDDLKLWMVAHEPDLYHEL